MKIKIFADGADKDSILDMNNNSIIEGFTTNPTLMRKAGINDYEEFAKDILKLVIDKPVSFEVFADDFEQMEVQARLIASWGENVYVKIPITNSKGDSSSSLIHKLSKEGIKLNITAIFTQEQVKEVAVSLKNGSSAFVSIFAGRIADTGIDPVPQMQAALKLLEPIPNAELLWASPREVLNIYQAESIGCHIITATNDIIKKLDLKGKSLSDFSQETVEMFYRDSKEAGFKL